MPLMGSQVRSNFGAFPNDDINKNGATFGSTFLFRPVSEQGWPVGKEEFSTKSQACIYISKKTVDWGFRMQSLGY